MMKKIFLDANVLFSAAYQAESGLLKFWKLKNVQLLTSTYAFQEALRNLDPEKQHQWLKKLMVSVTMVEEAHMPESLIPNSIALPTKDKPILAAAIQAKANYLITGDIRHFGKYFSKTISGVTIYPPAYYFKEK
jgi:predicted nucleic acid-binding protein